MISFYSGGGLEISEALKNSIESHLIRFSNFASNRLIRKNIGDLIINVPVRYLEQNIIDTYNSLPSKNIVSLSTFTKFIRKTGEYKNPHRLTDLCD